MEFKTFNEAFAYYRKTLGPGETFTWNGNSYSTNTADDKTYVVDGEEIIVPLEEQETFSSVYPNAALQTDNSNETEQNTQEEVTNSGEFNFPLIVATNVDGTTRVNTDVVYPQTEEEYYDDYVNFYQNEENSDAENFIEEEVSQYDVSEAENIELQDESAEDVIDMMAATIQNNEIQETNQHNTEQNLLENLNALQQSSPDLINNLSREQQLDLATHISTGAGSYLTWDGWTPAQKLSLPINNQQLLNESNISTFSTSNIISHELSGVDVDTELRDDTEVIKNQYIQEQALTNYLRDKKEENGLDISNLSDADKEAKIQEILNSEEFQCYTEDATNAYNDSITPLINTREIYEFDENTGGVKLNDDNEDGIRKPKTKSEEEIANLTDAELEEYENNLNEYNDYISDAKENNEAYNHIYNSVAEKRRMDLIEKNIQEKLDEDGFLDNWLTFRRSKEQRENYKLGLEHLDDLQDENKIRIGKMSYLQDVFENDQNLLADINTWFTETDAEIKEILEKEYTTQAEVDEANARLVELKRLAIAKQQDYKAIHTRALNYGSVIEKLHAEVMQGNLNEKQLAAYCGAMGRNPSQLLKIANSFVGAVADLGIGIVGGVDQLWDALDQTVEMLPDGKKKKIIETILDVNPGGMLFSDDNAARDWLGFDSTGGDAFNQFRLAQQEWREENIDSKLRPTQMFDEINNFGDALEWGTNMIAAQIPNLAMMAYTGNVGLVLMGVSSSGQKYAQMNDAKDLYYKTGGLYGMNHSFWDMQATAMLSGTAEALSEKFTLGTIRKTKGFLQAFRGGITKEMSRTAYVNHIFKHVLTPRNVAASGYEMFKEGTTEVMATLGGNMADIYIAGDKSVNIYDNVQESFLSGVLINGVIQYPRLHKMLRAPFESIDTKNLLLDNEKRRDSLNKELQDLRNSKDSNADILKRINEIQDEILQINEQSLNLIELDTKRVDVLHDSEKKALIEIEKRNNNDANQINKIKSDTKLSKETRDSRIKELENKIKSRQARKQQILDKYPPNVVNENYAAKVETLKKMAKMSEKMGGPKMNVTELSNDNFINKTAKYDYDQSKSQIKKIANQNQGLITSLNKIIQDPDSTPQEVQDAKNKLADATQQLDLANNILNSGDYGAMQPRFDSEGNISSLDILINKDTALTDGMLNTGAHEFVHATFANTLKSDPNMRKILGGQLKQILEGKGVTFSSQAKLDEFNARIQGYDPDVRGEEMMAIASEMMLDGDISFNDGVLQKLKDVFRRFSQNVLGYSIKFNTTEDIKNFMRDYHHSIENNKPSKAIAKMLAKGANGKIFKDARTPAERKSEAMYSKNLEAITKKNPDWKRDFDQYTQNPDGTPKYDTKEDFQTSDDFWPAFQQIRKSQALKNLIMAGTASETGINSNAEMDKFVNDVLDNIEDRYAGGLTKKARNEIKKIEDKRAKNELTPRETAEAIDKIENNPKSRKKGFDASAANGSLFGWLTNIAVYNAKRDVRKQFIKEQGGRGRKVSTSRQVGEGRTIADLLPGVTDVAMERFESERILEKAKVDPQNLKVEDILNLKPQTVNQIYDAINKSNIDISNITYKDVKKLLNESDRTKLKKLGQKVSSLTITPQGALYKILDTVSKEFGLDAKRILAVQDLDATQRKAAQDKILQMSINPDGTFNTQLLDMFPEGLDKDGRATGVANTALKSFYLKGGRVKVKEGALKELGQNYAKNKRTDVTLAEFLDVFGINENGTKRPGTKADGAIREAVLQIAQLQANQALRTHAIKTESHPANVIHKLGDGKSESMYSRKVPLYDNNEISNDTSAAIVNVVNNYGNSNYDSLIDNLIDQVTIENPNIKPKNLENLISTIEQLAYENLLQKQGKGYNSTIYNSNNTPNSVKKLFEVRGKTNQVVFVGPKLYDKQDNGYGKVNDAQVQYMNEVGEVLKSTHPDVSLKNLFPAFGIKDSGSKQFNGETTYSTRSINPKAHSGKIDTINKVNREVNRKKEEALMKKHGMSVAEINSLKFAQPMAFKGRVAQMIKALWAESSLVKKLQMLGQFQSEITNINNGNKAMMKYIAIKQMQARGNTMSDVNLYHLGAMQTNIIEGTRAWSTFKHIQLVEGKQWFGNKPGINVKNYDSKLKEYYRNWKKHPLFKQALNFAKKKYPTLKGDALLDKAINNLTPYNEHVAASSSTHAERLAYVFSGGKDMSLDNLVDHHASFFGHKFVANELLDKKQVIKGELVDNKISYEGDMRLTKFTDGYHSNIYHNSGVQVSEYVVKKEGLVDLANEIVKNKPGANISNKIGVIQEIQNKSLKSKKIPKVRGMSTFDFDDTLASTKSGVRARIPNTDGKPKPKRKVIFLAGGAGSGKSNVVKKLGLEGSGMKIVNQDISLEWLKKNSGLPTDMRDLTKEQRSILGKLGHQARGIAKRKMMKYQGNAEGIVVDGTGASAKQMNKLVEEFKAKGYDVGMIFVETSLETSLARNRARSERSLLDIIVKKNHESVMGNKAGFMQLFGDRFMEVNTDNMNIDSPMPQSLIDGTNDFLTSYENVRLDAEAFAEQGDDILKRGGEFDFSEFNEVVEGKEGPLLQKAIERAKKYGTKDLFILTARPQASAKAIQAFLKSQGLNIPLKNITGLADSSGNAKAEWMLNKFAEGYNDMYFVDDAMQNVDAVKHVLDQLDIKSKVVQAKLKDSNRIVKTNNDAMKSKVVKDVDPETGKDAKDINVEFNEMIGRTTDIDPNKRYHRAEAIVEGRVKGKFDFFIPPSAEDFKGLMYKLLGTGKQGDADLKWIKDKLLTPFAKGIRDWNAFKQRMVNEYRALKKKLPDAVKLLKEVVPNTNFNNDAAIRVYLWNKNGIDIPGLSNAMKKTLSDHVANNPDLKAYADALGEISRAPDGYVIPTDTWMVETIGSDLNNFVNKDGRKQFLSEWLANKDIIFSTENLAKLEAAYGSDYVDALKGILHRMETGRNRPAGNSKIVNNLMDWINGSVGAVMFFNIRSAALQTISTVNFINWGDNNIFKAAAAFANIPQFAKDFAFIFNSDMLKQRRGGLQIDVNASELTNVFSEKGSSPKKVLQWLLEKGFLPTRLADSFAIAFGGASMYRNRYNKYIKEGMTEAEAKEQAWLDFQEIAEETQQSSRPDLISEQQAGPLGRLVLAWQNTPMQMTRLMKKALSDLVNGRGDMKTNISKILYYGAVQNIIFSSLQNGLGWLMFEDDEDEELIRDKTKRAINNSLDTILRGTGVYGAAVAAIKNTIIQWDSQRQKGWGKKSWDKVITEIMSFSPPIGSKLRKIMNAIRTDEFNEGVAEQIPWRVENPRLAIWANIIEATLNIPLARLVNKANNLEEAINGNHELWKRIALVSGWNKWDVGVEDQTIEEARNRAKEQIKIEKKKEKEIQKQKEEEDKKKQGIKTIQCSGIRSNGERCKLTTETKAKTWKCAHHAAFVDGSDTDGDGIKEYRCTATKSNGDRCKNKTENKNKKCYAHQ